MTENTMKDVSHTAPYGDGVGRVWERGHEYATEENRADGNGAPAADD